MFSSLVNTLGLDLEAIKEDLQEFGTTVKEETTRVLRNKGMGEDDGNNTNETRRKTTKKQTTTTRRRWDQEIDFNVLLVDPQEQGWDEVGVAFKKEEIDALLQDAHSSVPDVYRKLVPSKVSHADIFKRLAYYKRRTTTNMSDSMMSHDAIMAGHQEQQDEEMDWEAQDDNDQTNTQNKDTQRGEGGNEHNEVARLMDKVAELEKKLHASETRRKELEILVTRLQQQQQQPPNSATTPNNNNVTTTTSPQKPEDVSSNNSWEEARAESAPMVSDTEKTGEDWEAWE
jgi:hypothetical protein